ncbi:MAG: hypothetical protein IJF71_05165 [Clostridia bacterium]|nr:hypothetical protein [Clostridia bacterium]
MQFIWLKNGGKRNETAVFQLKTEGLSSLVLAAADVYAVYADGKRIGYGPNRTASGYARPVRYSLGGCSVLTVVVCGFGIDCYQTDRGWAYFAAEAEGRKGRFSSEDFVCYALGERVRETDRFSCQRPFVEGYRLTHSLSALWLGNICREPEATEEVPAPVLLAESEDRSSLAVHSLGKAREEVGVFSPGIRPDAWWYGSVQEGLRGGFKREEVVWDIPREFYAFQKAEGGNKISELYDAGAIVTGSLKIRVRGCGRLTVGWSQLDIKQGDVLKIDRNACFDCAAWDLQEQGTYELETLDVYDLRYLQLLHDETVTVEEVQMLLAHNRHGTVDFTCESEALSAVMQAAKSTFCQNALDIFMDCPGRERAGWLCDSFFTSQAEQLFTGGNAVERDFLQNFLLAKTPELPEGMLPMCFPSEHPDGVFIPNWAMWYFIELCAYTRRTGDREMLNAARGKAEGLIAYFNTLKNSDGLLENLQSWIFVEWSIANSEEYVKGVNYPSNMLYAMMLNLLGEAYGVAAWQAEAAQMKRVIREQSYNGTFFEDNAVRDKEGALMRLGHISETCQYYALFCGIQTDEAFQRRVKEELGPFRREGAHKAVGKSNAFIGNYLRLFWLTEQGEHGRVLDESVQYFYGMAQQTGTLWEHDQPEASCNHGFASAAAVLLYRAVFGYYGFTAEDGVLFTPHIASITARATVSTPMGRFALYAEKGRLTRCERADG